MDFRLTSEQEALRKKKRRISRRNMSSRWRRAGRKAQFPHENVKRMADLGFLGLPIPKEYGGRRYGLCLLCSGGGRDRKDLRVYGDHHIREHIVGRRSDSRYGTDEQKKNFFRIWLREERSARSV